MEEVIKGGVSANFNFKTEIDRGRTEPRDKNDSAGLCWNVSTSDMKIECSWIVEYLIIRKKCPFMNIYFSVK